MPRFLTPSHAALQNVLQPPLENRTNTQEDTQEGRAPARSRKGHCWTWRGQRQGRVALCAAARTLSAPACLLPDRRPEMSVPQALEPAAGAPPVGSDGEQGTRDDADEAAHGDEAEEGAAGSPPGAVPPEEQGVALRQQVRA